MLKLRYNPTTGTYYLTSDGRVVLSEVPESYPSDSLHTPESKDVLGLDGKLYNVCYYHNGDPAQVVRVEDNKLSVLV